MYIDPVSDSPIRDVSDTAYLVAAQRAVESERPDALFRDPYARPLAGERGDAILARIPAPARALSAWSVAIRTRVIDELIAAAIATGIDAILDLGAGFDTRPYRMTLPPMLRWIEVDTPAILDPKTRALAADAPVCQLERTTLDLADAAARRRWLASITGRVLVLTEGVVPYLTVEQVGELADDLHAIARGWIAEYLAPSIVQRRRQSTLLANAMWQFTPDDWFGFFAEHGWRAADTRFLVDEGVRLGRPAPVEPSGAPAAAYVLYAPQSR